MSGPLSPGGPSGGSPGLPVGPAIRFYREISPRWSIHCEEEGCGAPVDTGFCSQQAAAEYLADMRASDGIARCDTHWIEPADDGGDE